MTLDDIKAGKVIAVAERGSATELSIIWSENALWGFTRHTPAWRLPLTDCEPEQAIDTIERQWDRVRWVGDA